MLHAISERKYFATLCSLVAVFLTLSAGCQSGSKKKSETRASPPKSTVVKSKAVKTKLAVSGEGKLLDRYEENEARLLSGWGEKLSAATRQGHRFSAGLLVKQSPEYALRWLWLVSSDPQRRTNERLSLRIVAQLYDRHVLNLDRATAQLGWFSAIKWMDEHPSAYHSYLERKRILSTTLSKNENTARAYEKLQIWLSGQHLPLQLMTAAKAAWMMPVSITGPNESAYWATLKRQVGADPLLMMHAHLNLGEVSQHFDFLMDAAECGRQLSKQQIFPSRQWQRWLMQRQKSDGRMILEDQSRLDQMVLATLGDLLGPDVQLSWQTSIREWLEMQTAKARTGGALDGIKCLVQANVGLGLLEIGFPQQALLILKKAELNGRNISIENELRLHQARSLAAMNQVGGATSLLMPLITLDRPVGRSALSALAVIKLQQDQLPQAIELWKRSLAHHSLEAWPGRVQAQADLGLAYLMQGYEQKGLDLLHKAQASMKMVDQEVWLISLENERQYYEQMGQHKEALKMQQKIAMIQASDVLRDV